MIQSYLWWQTGVIYQIYPRSFADSNQDGVGDLVGIANQLDYLQWLGIDVVWLSPIFPSPMADFGYDVSDYVDIDPVFGTLHDFDYLLREVHGRGMKLMLDLVPNHSSDEHAWFVASRASHDNPRRDWYIWRDPAPDGGPPNNWASHFGGPAWTLDEKTGQYYLHLFDPKQPDLNWRNPHVRTAMFDMMRFWLNRGVDGFRVDVIWMLIKDDQWRDNPDNPDWKPGDPPWMRQQFVYTEDRPEVHEIIRQMRAVMDAYDERVLIGEIYLPIARLMDYYGANLDETHMPFNFSLAILPTWDAPSVRQLIETYEAALPPGAWPNWVLGNHDLGRVASRVGRAQARVAAMLLLTLRGTPTCYYGDELGMANVTIPPEKALDPQELRSPGHGRDPCRTPMQWDSSPYAGFSTVEPWLPVADDYPTWNVATQRADPTSLLSLSRRLLGLRRALPALTVGNYAALDAGTDAVLAYLRSEEKQRVLVVLNFSATPQQADLSALADEGHLLCTTHMDSEEVRLPLTGLALRPHEGLVIQVDGW